MTLQDILVNILPFHHIIYFNITSFYITCLKDSCIILIIKAENFVFLSKMSLCYTFIKHDFTKYFVVHIVTSHRITSCITSMQFPSLSPSLSLKECTPVALNKKGGSDCVGASLNGWSHSDNICVGTSVRGWGHSGPKAGPKNILFHRIRTYQLNQWDWDSFLLFCL